MSIERSIERYFYEIVHEGQRLTLPRVTSILRIIDRSGPLMGWATKVEREVLRAALEDVLTTPGVTLAPQVVWDRMQDVLKGKRAWVKARDDAANIGQAAHAMIHWHTKVKLGLDAGPEPSGPDEALRAVVAWMDWCREVDFTPQHVERLLYCPQCAFAGTCDVIAKVRGQLTLIDYKTGRAVYDEAHLQVLAYRHMAAREGIVTEAGLILRLPKTAADPAFEAVPAVDIPYGYWVSTCRVWRWQRLMEGEYAGPDMTKCEIR